MASISRWSRPGNDDRTVVTLLTVPASDTQTRSVEVMGPQRRYSSGTLTLKPLSRGSSRAWPRADGSVRSGRLGSTVPGSGAGRAIGAAEAGALTRTIEGATWLGCGCPDAALDAGWSALDAAWSALDAAWLDAGWSTLDAAWSALGAGWSVLDAVEGVEPYAAGVPGAACGGSAAITVGR